MLIWNYDFFSLNVFKGYQRLSKHAIKGNSIRGEYVVRTLRLEIREVLKETRFRSIKIEATEYPVSGIGGRRPVDGLQQHQCSNQLTAFVGGFLVDLAIIWIL